MKTSREIKPNSQLWYSSVDAIMTCSGATYNQAVNIIESLGRRDKEVFNYIDCHNHMEAEIVKPFSNYCMPTYGFIVDLYPELSKPENMHVLSNIFNGIVYGEKNEDCNKFLKSIEMRKSDPAFKDLVYTSVLKQMRRETNFFVRTNSHEFASQGPDGYLKNRPTEFVPFEIKGWDNMNREMGVVDALSMIPGIYIDRDVLKHRYDDQADRWIRNNVPNGENIIKYAIQNYASLDAKAKEALTQREYMIEYYPSLDICKQAIRLVGNSELSMREKIDEFKKYLDNYKLGQNETKMLNEKFGQHFSVEQFKDNLLRCFKNSIVIESLERSLLKGLESPVGRVNYDREKEKEMKELREKLLNDSKQRMDATFNSFKELTTVFVRGIEFDNVMAKLFEFKIPEDQSFKLVFDKDNISIVPDKPSKFAKTHKQVNEINRIIEQDIPFLLKDYAIHIFESKGLVIGESEIDSIEKKVSKMCSKFGFDATRHFGNSIIMQEPQYDKADQSVEFSR